MGIPALPTNAVKLLVLAVMLAGCSTSRPVSTVSLRPASSLQALQDHQRKQAIRAREGGYERLYRPRVCRSNVGPCVR